MQKFAPAIILLTLIGLAAGCSDRSEIEGGNYEAYEVSGHDSAEQAAILATQLNVDRDSDTATFTLDDGSQIVTSWTTRDRSDWPTGCPTNYSSTKMEILDLDEDVIMIQSLAFTSPVLVASCPGGSTDVVLTEDVGSANLGGVPCDPGTDICLWFSLVND